VVKSLFSPKTPNRPWCLPSLIFKGYLGRSGGSLEVKWPSREADCRPSFISYVQNELSYKSTLPNGPTPCAQRKLMLYNNVNPGILQQIRSWLLPLCTGKMICTGGQVAQAPERCKVESNNCGSSEWTLLHDTFLASRNLNYSRNLKKKKKKKKRSKKKQIIFFIFK